MLALFVGKKSGLGVLSGMLAKTAVAVGLVAILVACDSGNETVPNFSIGGTVSGLTGSGLVLQNNAGDNLIISANGAFTFATPVTSGGNYAVTVKTHPTLPSQTCTVSNGSGTVSGADVAVTIQCAEAYVLPTSATDISLGANSVLVDGNKVYVIAGTAFKVLDVSNPLSPSLLGTVTHGYTDLRVEAHAIHDNIVWCVRSSSGGYGGGTYVFGVDVRNPAIPVVRGSLTLQTGTSLLTNTSLIYEGYWLVHDYSDNLIYVIDISNPDAPVKYSQWGVPNMVNGGPGHMMIDGTLLYLPCGEASVFKIYDLAVLATVTEVGSVSMGAQSYGTAVKIGSYVYTIDSAMKIIDVSNPAAPTIAGTVAATGNLKGKNGKLFSLNGATIYAYSLADPIAPVVEEFSTVPAPAPSTSLNMSPISSPAAAWVGNYLIGMTYGSAPQYDGARALNFTVN